MVQGEAEFVDAASPRTDRNFLRVIFNYFLEYVHETPKAKPASLQIYLGCFVLGFATLIKFGRGLQVPRSPNVVSFRLALIAKVKKG